MGSVIYTYVALEARQSNMADGGTFNLWVPALIGEAQAHQ